MAESLPSVIDIDSLLQPIEGENPTGESLQYSGIYDEIREARRADDPLAGEWQGTLKTADWRKVIDLSTPALTTQSKDLQIAAWLSEAVAKLHGLIGVRDGLRLMKGLHENFWDNLYPEIDEGDMEARGNALAWMDRQLAEIVKEVPLTNASGQNFNFLQYEESKQFDFPENLENLPSEQSEQLLAKKQQAEEDNKVTGEMWRKAYGMSRRAFYEQTLTTMDECWEAYQDLDRIMDDKFGNQTPGLGELRKNLDLVKTAIEKFVKEKRIQEPDAADMAAEGEGGVEGAVGGGIGGGSGPVRSRQEALRRLSEVAEYFRRAEPHSPVSYLVSRAVKWGQMPLDVWLSEVVRDTSTLGQLQDLLGISSYSGSDESGGGYDSGGGDSSSSW
jgi:type VI secretion system protein ImpA